MSKREQGPELSPEKGLDEVLRRMQEITAEWEKPTGERNEGVRREELPLVERLSKMEIPAEKSEEVLRVIKAFRELADDQSVDPVLDEIAAKLTAA